MFKMLQKYKIIYIFLILFLFSCKKNNTNSIPIIDVSERESEKITLLKELHNIEPNNDEYILELAIQYIKEKNFLNAIKWLKKIEEKNYNNFEVIYYLGVAYQFINKNQIAIEYYKHAIELNESEPKIYFNIGKIYFKEFNYEEALKYLSKGLLFCKNDEEKIEIYWYLATIFYKNNENQKALKYYRLFYTLSNTKKLKIKYFEKRKDTKIKLKKIIEYMKFYGKK